MRLEGLRAPKRIKGRGGCSYTGSLPEIDFPVRGPEIRGRRPELPFLTLLAPFLCTAASFNKKEGRRGDSLTASSTKGSSSSGKRTEKQLAHYLCRNVYRNRSNGRLVCIRAGLFSNTEKPYIYYFKSINAFKLILTIGVQTLECNGCLQHWKLESEIETLKSKSLL
jgi:hypothetical protein